jgi:hypothetical protein
LGVSGILGTEEFSHMKRFGILALAFTFLTGAAVSSFAQDAPKKEETKKKKKKKKADDDKK